MKVAGMTLDSATMVNVVACDKTVNDFMTMLTLKAPAVEEQENDKRPAIDLVLCVDRSGSMHTLMPLVIETIQFVISQLSPKDRLCLIQYDDRVDTLCEFIEMDKAGKTTAIQLATALQSRGGTNLAAGLFTGMKKAAERSKANDVCSVLLFTDGQANAGITDEATIVQRMKSGGYKNASPDAPPPYSGSFGGFGVQSSGGFGSQRSLFGNAFSTIKNAMTSSKEKPQEESKESQESEKESEKAQSFTVNTFGFGPGHNQDLLRSISEAGSGMYFYVENSEAMADAFIDCVGGLISVVAQEISLQIEFPEGIELLDVLTSYPKKTSNFMDGRTTAVINIKDMQSEEQRDILFKIKLPPTDVEVEQKLFKARVDYNNMILNPPCPAFNEVSCSVSRKVEGSFNPVQNIELANQVNRLSVAKTLQHCKEIADRGGLQQARSKLDSMVKELRESVASKETKTQELERALVKAKEELVDQTSWTNVGSKAFTSSSMGFQQQRFSSRTKAAMASPEVAAFGFGSSPYENLAQKKMKSNFQLFKSSRA